MWYWKSTAEPVKGHTTHLRQGFPMWHVHNPLHREAPFLATAGKLLHPQAQLDKMKVPCVPNLSTPAGSELGKWQYPCGFTLSLLRSKKMPYCHPHQASIPFLEEGRHFLDVTGKEALEVPALVSLFSPRERHWGQMGTSGKHSSTGPLPQSSSEGQHVASAKRCGMHVMKTAMSGSTGRAAPCINQRCPKRSGGGMARAMAHSCVLPQPKHRPKWGWTRRGEVCQAGR